jgi:8-oxo-dGTP diphosphatase
VCHEDKVLLTQRINSHGHESWAFPGGHLEDGEEIIDCGLRELQEELGIGLHDPFVVPVVTNDIFTSLNKHYETHYIQGKYT